MKLFAIVLGCLVLAGPIPALASKAEVKKVKAQVVKEVTVVKNVVTAIPFAVPVAVPVATVANPQIFYGVSGCPQPCPPDTQQGVRQSAVHGAPEIKSLASPHLVKNCGACHIQKSDAGLNFGGNDLTTEQVLKSIKYVREGKMPLDKNGESIVLDEAEKSATVNELLELLTAGS